MLNGRSHVYQLHSANMTSHLINTIPHNGIMFFISASGKWGRTIELARDANLHNMITIGITPYTNNEIALQCKHNLRFFTQPKENEGAEFTSRLCVYYAIDTLISFYATLKKEVQP